jgi:putative two-component system response regulator
VETAFVTENKGNILIVDDEAVIRGLLCRKLTRDGYVCGEADCVDNALGELGNRPYELVISDIRMPGRTGIDLLTEVKAKYRDTAVIMATAVNEISTAIQCLTQGADDYVFKPFDLSQVSTSVERSLEKRRLQLSINNYQHTLEEKVEQQTAEIRKLSLGGIEALISALEAKDQYTAGHSRRVTEISIAIGKALGLEASEIEDLRWGGLLHDVGKIAVDQMVQNKPGRLTKEEYEHIMIHAQVGAGIVKPVVNERVLETVKHHHDHFNGKGLNQTEGGKATPLGARIVAVADSFDAMTSDRPYRQAMSLRDAIAEIQLCSGSQFDPDVVAAFLKTYATGNVSV